VRATSFLGIRARTAGLKDFQLPDACLRADVRFDKLKFEQTLKRDGCQKHPEARILDVSIELLVQSAKLGESTLSISF
jgi:hypothetical protein